jgi:hypothetical protein
MKGLTTWENPLSKRFSNLARLIGTTLVLTLLLSGCGRTAGPGPEPIEPASSFADGPPRSTLSFNGETQTGGIGSFCWKRGCADMAGIPVPNDSLTVPAGRQLAFEFSGSEPLTEVHAAARPLRGRLIDGAGMRLLQSAEGETVLPATPSGNQTGITAELEPGEYSVTVSIRIAGGDALYGFHVVIR